MTFGPWLCRRLCRASLATRRMCACSPRGCGSGSHERLASLGQGNAESPRHSRLGGDDHCFRPSQADNETLSAEQRAAKDARDVLKKPFIVALAKAEHRNFAGSGFPPTRE